MQTLLCFVASRLFAYHFLFATLFMQKYSFLLFACSEFLGMRNQNTVICYLLVARVSFRLPLKN